MCLVKHYRLTLPYSQSTIRWGTFTVIVNDIHISLVASFINVLKMNIVPVYQYFMGRLTTFNSELSYHLFYVYMYFTTWWCNHGVIMQKLTLVHKVLNFTNLVVGKCWSTVGIHVQAKIDSGAPGSQEEAGKLEVVIFTSCLWNQIITPLDTMHFLNLEGK